MALTSQDKSKCGAKLFWASDLWSASPGIPRNPSAISRLSYYYLEAPGPVPTDLIVAVSGPRFKTHEHKAGLQRVSPGEIRIASCHAIAKLARDYKEAVAVGQTHAAIAGVT